MPNPTPLAQTVGRRKTSVARVRLYDGTGSITLNGKQLDDYFPVAAQRLRVMEPMRVASVDGRYDVIAKLEGGGTTGQVDALRLGIARALTEINPELRAELKAAGLLTRDARAVERKKYGLKKARRAEQYTKR
jgi:small subunit ribosomal protein S9